MDGLLLSMPSARSSSPSPAVRAGLEALSLQGNALARVPPELAAATALEFLDLSRNQGLALGPVDVDALAALPALRQVRLGPGTAVGAAALLSLLLRAPHLDVSTEEDSDEE